MSSLSTIEWREQALFPTESVITIRLQPLLSLLLFPHLPSRSHHTTSKVLSNGTIDPGSTSKGPLGPAFCPPVLKPSRRHPLLPLPNPFPLSHHTYTAIRLTSSFYPASPTKLPSCQASISLAKAGPTLSKACPVRLTTNPRPCLVILGATWS